MKLKYNKEAHGYWLNGKRCKGVSGVASVPEDKFAISTWNRRNALIGVAQHPELLTEIAANIDNKDKLDEIAERAGDFAGGSAGRNWGSAVHLIIERTIDGRPILDTPETMTVRQAFNKLLADNRLEVVASEIVVVHPELMIAGRTDLVLRCMDTKVMFIADAKTGASADRYLHSSTVQTYLYASAPLMGVGPQGDVDFEITEFSEMYPVSQTVGLIIHIPQDGEASIIPVDLVAGRDCFENVILPTYAWRNRKDLRVPMPVRKVYEPLEPLVKAAPPAEGPDVAVDALRARYVALSSVGRTWVDAKREEAFSAGVDFHLAKNFTMRRAGIMDGLIALAEAEADDDDAVRAICRLVIADEFVEWPTVKAGAVVGSLGAAEADAFASACHMFVGGLYGLEVRLDGPVLVEVAA
jgi:hypothetical protein